MSIGDESMKSYEYLSAGNLAQEGRQGISCDAISCDGISCHTEEEKEKIKFSSGTELERGYWDVENLPVV